MAKRRKKARVKREPKPQTWLIFKSFNQTKEEVYFGVSMTTPKWQGSKYDLRGIPELAHWDLEEDKIMITKIYKRKRFASKELASYETQYYERTYVHWRNFWVVQTGKNKLGPQRERKLVKPPRLPRGYYYDTDMIEEEEMEEDDVTLEEIEEDEIEEEEEDTALEEIVREEIEEDNTALEETEEDVKENVKKANVAKDTENEVKKTTEKVALSLEEEDTPEAKNERKLNDWLKTFRF